MSDVDISINVNGILAKENHLIKQNQMKLDVQILKDSNYFCPMDVGTLKTSAKIEQPGEIVWDQQYAKAQYYGKPNKSKDKNPFARMKWFEEAKVLHKEEWLKIAQGNI